MTSRLFEVPSGESPGGPPAGGVGEPLAARMRPRTLAELAGHGDVVGQGTPLRTMLDAGDLTSMILWGPPGSGKTSIARVIAAHVDAAWTELSAVTAGVKDVRRVIDEGRERLASNGRRTILFLDEIHRFNKAQQDALLPAVEAGWVTLVGATTENPYFELNAPLMSRCKLVRLEALDRDAMRQILERALSDPERGYGGQVTVSDEAMTTLIAAGDGDARTALNVLEVSVKAAGEQGAIDADTVVSGLGNLRYDRGDAHYDQISAFIKSMRGSDPDAAVYWLLRMLVAGEDPLFLARRLVILASEDVGLADRGALPIAMAAYQAVERVGLPEAEYALVHATLALAMAPKSNAVARALGAGKRLVKEHGNAPVPLHLRDAHSRAGRTLGHGTGYDYPHDHPGGWVAQQYLPDGLQGARLYEPTTHGAEADVRERLAAMREAGRKARG
jgi:putative ATPase